VLLAVVWLGRARGSGSATLVQKCRTCGLRFKRAHDTIFDGLIGAFVSASVVGAEACVGGGLKSPLDCGGEMMSYINQNIEQIQPRLEAKTWVT
jgi:hypothetical protein